MERGAEVEEGIGSEKEREAGGAGHDARGGREKIGEEEAGGERSGEWGLRERGKGGLSREGAPAAYKYSGKEHLSFSLPETTDLSTCPDVAREAR